VKPTCGAPPSVTGSSTTRSTTGLDGHVFAAPGDTSGMAGTLSSSHLVGRAGELAELELALRESSHGYPALVLLGGESGVGKTRLVSEFEREVRGGEEPPLVLRGEAVEQGEG
jgi:hypothetical protein